MRYTLHFYAHMYSMFHQRQRFYYQFSIFLVNENRNNADGLNMYTDLKTCKQQRNPINDNDDSKITDC